MPATKLNAPLNPAQLEILKLFSRELTEEDLLAIKRLIVKYLAEKATRMADQIWQEKGWTNEDRGKLSHTHLRRDFGATDEP